MHLCPDFVIELRSDTDRLKRLQQKLREHLANGAQLGWLIDPESQSVEIYRPDGSVELHSGSTICGRRARSRVRTATRPRLEPAGKLASLLPPHGNHRDVVVLTPGFGGCGDFARRHS